MSSFNLYIKKNISEKKLTMYLWDTFKIKNSKFLSSNDDIDGIFILDNIEDYALELNICSYHSKIFPLQIAIYIAKDFSTEVAFDKDINDEWNDEFIIVNKFGELLIGVVDLNENPFKPKKIKPFDFSHKQF